MFDLNSIKTNEDKVLISDAVKLCDQNCYRAAYIIAWLACVEALKRRFLEAGKKANNINKCVGEIKQREDQHKSIDKFIIEKAKEFDFISDTEKEKLDYFYKMRCIYSHPYEQAPSKLDCEHIIDSIISIVLSRPVFLSEGAISSIIERLVNERSFLNDNQHDVNDFIIDILKRIEPKCYKFFFEKLIKEFEKLERESKETLIYNRLKYSAVSILSELGFSKLFNSDAEIENFIYEHKMSSLVFFTLPETFRVLNQREKDILFNLLIENPNHQILNCLYSEKLLTNSQISRVQELIKSLSCSDMNHYAAVLIVDSVIDKLKSYNWNTQNPVYSILNSDNFISTIQDVDDDKQIILGRNILQAADVAWAIENFLNELQNKTELYPENLIKGIFLECFINEKKRIRPKLGNIVIVESIFQKFTDSKKKDFLDAIESEISSFEDIVTDGWDDVNDTSPFAGIKDCILRLNK